MDTYLTMIIDNEPLTLRQLNAFERVIDKVFNRIGIDIEFTRHFIDRVNDARNYPPITLQDLIDIFKKEYIRWGKTIANLNPGSEAVMKDLNSDVNIPFVLEWDRINHQLELRAKTIMRKKHFRTTNKIYPVESVNVMKLWEAYYQRTKLEQAMLEGGHAVDEKVLNSLVNIKDLENKIR